MSEIESDKYLDHLVNIGRKYFTRPEHESPTTEMTFFEKCRLTGYLLKEEDIYLKVNDNAKKMLITGESKDEKEFLELIKNECVNVHEIFIKKLLESKLKELENGRSNQQVPADV